MNPADLLSLGSGGLVGFALGLLGGGGSILAVPLLVYVVGIKDAHVAIGTSALAVSVNAFANLISHARAQTVKWPCATAFALSGMAGAVLGAFLGRHVDGQHLLFLFGLVMLAVAAGMFGNRAAGGDPLVHINPAIAVRLVGAGLVVGFASGFFGIGGGFLIVPAIMLGSGMASLNAVGSSLVSVGAFGLATAMTYAAAGLVDWRVPPCSCWAASAAGWWASSCPSACPPGAGCWPRSSRPPRSASRCLSCGNRPRASCPDGRALLIRRKAPVVPLRFYLRNKRGDRDAAEHRKCGQDRPRDCRAGADRLCAGPGFSRHRLELAGLDRLGADRHRPVRRCPAYSLIGIRTGL